MTYGDKGGDSGIFKWKYDWHFYCRCKVCAYDYTIRMINDWIINVLDKRWLVVFILEESMVHEKFTVIGVQLPALMLLSEEQIQDKF